jgi:hypothetical protein
MITPTRDHGKLTVPGTEQAASDLALHYRDRHMPRMERHVS